MWDLLLEECHVMVFNKTLRSFWVAEMVVVCTAQSSGLYRYVYRLLYIT